MNNPFHTKLTAAVITALLLAGHMAQAVEPALPDPLPDPDGKPADVSKPVKVFILLGQSNMLGFGQVLGEKEGTLAYAVKQGKYPYLVDDAGNWTVRKDVRNVRVMNFKDEHVDWLIPTANTIGPEIGIGHYLGYVVDEPVLLLKSCIGNRSLGFDLLPPGSEPFKFGDKIYPGYRGTSDNPKGTGEKPDADVWYAGKQYDDDIGSAKQVLGNLDQYYPGAKTYEVAGFFWWQGDKDMRDAGLASYYEKNLQHLTDVLREEFNAPEAKFVFASLGQTKEGSTGGDGQIMEAMKSVAARQPGKAGFVYTYPLSMGGSSSGHYNKHAETYMNVGEAMGKAMVELLNSKAAAPAGKIRTWTSLGGRTLEAKVIADMGDKVLLETEDGTTLEFAKSVLSAADQAYLKNR